MKNVVLENLVIDQMAAIPSGEIAMRDDRTGEKWTVDIKAFSLAKFTVNQELYFEVMHNNPSVFKGLTLPVDSVSWKEAVLFCNTLSLRLSLKPCYVLDEEEVTYIPANGFRLPTEAEWEYACKAGTTGIRYGDLDTIAWYKDNSNRSTHPVGSKVPNQWGLYDMLGNVWEWCSDLYDTEVYGSYRIFRGGGWCDEERSVMATTRRRSHPSSFKIDDLGFRIAQNKV